MQKIKFGLKTFRSLHLSRGADFPRIYEKFTGLFEADQKCFRAMLKHFEDPLLAKFLGRGQIFEKSGQKDEEFVLMG